MKLSYLPLLVDGKIPEDDNYVILNKNRKKEVKSAEFKGQLQLFAPVPLVELCFIVVIC